MNNFEKRQWVRLILCVLVLIAVSLFLTGIIGGEHMTYSLTEKTDGPAVNGTAVEETEQGFGGAVTVKATMDGSTVQALTVETPDETPGLGQRASEEDFTSQFIGKEGPFTFGENGIDALSGATVTSNAVLKALNRAITGEDAEAPVPAAEEVPEEETAPAAAEETKAEEPAPEVKEEPAQEPAAESAAEAAGTAVEETEQGFGGKVTVKATLDGSKVTALTVETPDETPGLGQKASEEAFTSQFIGKEGPFTYGENGIEALSGATVTSDAVLKALNRAIGGEAAEPAAEPVKEEKTEPAAEAAQAPAEDTKAKASGVVYGSYTAKRETPFSYIRVAIDTKDGKITDCRITSEAKSEGSDFMTDEIRTEWAKAIVESGTADPDVITGATLKMSSAQVVDAVNEILEGIQ